MAPAHQYQPPSVAAATIKPAASTTPLASPSRHHWGTLNSRCKRIWAQHHEVRRGMEGWASAQLMSPGPIIEHR